MIDEQIQNQLKRYVKKSLILGQEVYDDNKNALLQLFFKKNDERALKYVEQMYEDLELLESQVDQFNDYVGRETYQSIEASSRPRYNKLNVLKRLKPLSLQLTTISDSITDGTIDLYELRIQLAKLSLSIAQMKKDVKQFIDRMNKYLKSL